MGNSDRGTTYMRVGKDDGKLRTWHYIYVYSTPPHLLNNFLQGSLCN